MSDENVEPFKFTGNAAEYFGIWIVNLFLTIVTLGIYSAWAKVRKKRYFYGHTWLAGTNFEYHGRPIAILKGRIIAFGVFAAYTLGAQFSPRIAALVALAFMPAIPWLLLRSFAFNAANSSYRNLRFHFKATYREAAVAIAPAALFPLLALVMPQIDRAAKPTATDMAIAFVPLAIFWMIYPYLVAATRRLHINHSRYGIAPFALGATVGDFYKVYGLATLVFAAVLLAVGGLVAAAVMAAPMVAIGLLPFAYVIVFAVLFGFTRAKVGNLVFNKTTLEQRLGFVSTLSATRLAWIYASNMVVVICTIGLMIPWAVVRTARYRAECIGVRCDGDLESFLGEMAARVDATGEEMGEMFDVDLSL